jgi:hypothetical protein
MRHRAALALLWMAACSTNDPVAEERDSSAGTVVDGSGGAPDGASSDATPALDCLGPWTGQDDVPASASPPCGLAADDVPLLVSIGFDDNGRSGLPGSGDDASLAWALAMADSRTNPDGSRVRFSFYFSTFYIASFQYESPTTVKRAWHQALVDGHEVGDHTHSHQHGGAFTVDDWRAEMQTCIDWLVKPFDPDEPITPHDRTKGIGAAASDIVGFRTPYLEFNDEAFAALDAMELRYDCSISDGFHPAQGAQTFVWPYTLDDGDTQGDVGSHPGLWEMPVHPIVVPPDEECEAYGVPPGLRARLGVDEEDGEITGFDYNLWELASMSKAEVVATLKYTLDQRLAGNRAPMMFGAHTENYASDYPTPRATPAERREAIEEFLDYALSRPEVRVMPNRAILDWVRNPVPL